MISANIDLTALNHNLKKLQALLKPQTKIMGIIKANAYGHGDLTIYQHLLQQKLTYFGVARLEEGIKLRQIKTPSTILILSPINPSSFSQALKHQLTLTITDPDSLVTLNSTAKKLKLTANIHIKVNTGMNRSGCSPKDASTLLRLAQALPYIRIDGLFTHFADADNQDLQFTKDQLLVLKELFSQLKKQKLLPPIVHAANSAAIISHPDSHFDLVRPGIALYGLNPFGQDKNNLDLKPILTLTSKITSIRTLKPGEIVGYGKTYTANKEMKICTVAAGYADGIRRGPKPWPHVTINNQLAPIIGRVSMDQITIDITDINPAPTLFQDVTLISNQTDHPNSLDKLVPLLGTNNYEIVSSLANRVTRIYT